MESGTTTTTTIRIHVDHNNQTKVNLDFIISTSLYFLINGSNWAPTDWTCYKQAIRTNNDVEGWHNGLNRRASGRAQLPMYLLIQLLYREAKLTAIQIRLVSERKLRRIQRRKYRELQQRIFELWDQYEAGERSARRLLKACSYLNGPVEL